MYRGYMGIVFKYVRTFYVLFTCACNSEYVRTQVCMNAQVFSKIYMRTWNQYVRMWKQYVRTRKQYVRMW